MSKNRADISSSTNAAALNALLTVKVCVGLAGDVGARAEVDELDLGDALGDVDEDVLVLDVAVDDAALVAGQHRPQHLPEEAARHRLLQPPLLRDEVEEVLAAGRPLQDQDVRVGPLVKVQQADHAGHARHLPQQADLQGDALALVLKIEEK